MGKPGHTTVTALLQRARGGERGCLEQVIPVVYDQLRRLAAVAVRGERPGHSLQPTSLVHEAYLRLVDQTGILWEDRAHFFAIAAREMRRVLVDHARQQRAKKRGGGRHRMTLLDGDAAVAGASVDLLALDEALAELAALKQRHHRVVELRFFGGLTHKEIAEVLGVSEETVKKDWQFARVWLGRRLRAPENDEA